MGEVDPNPIIDPGCPRSIGGELSARRLCDAIGIDFELDQLDCNPFWHGYGDKCSDAKQTIGIWRLPISDMNGYKTEIPFYITAGSGLLLLGNEIFHQSNLLGSENLLLVPSGVHDLSDCDLHFPTYNEPVGPPNTNGMRTYLLVVPSKTAFFSTFFAVASSFAAKHQDGLGDLSEVSTADRFARKLHQYSHLSVEDMKTLCERANVLNPVLSKALQVAFTRCTSCKSTGRPSIGRKISLGKVLAAFNDHVQIDFLFISELVHKPILHIVDVHTGFSATAITDTRDITIVARALELNWINSHGPPSKISGDPEFLNQKFAKAVSRFCIDIEQRAARRHQKIGVVERKNAVVRTIVQRLIGDVEFLTKATGSESASECRPELLSRATYLSNILYGSKTLSSFEMVRGYTPSIAGLPQSRVATKLQEAHDEQTTRRAAKLVLSGRTPNLLSPEDLPRGKPVYFFRRKPKPKWLLAFVRKAEEHLVQLSTRSDHSGKPVRAAYEDVRTVPSCPLLKDIDLQDPVFPYAESILDEPVNAAAQQEPPDDDADGDNQVPSPDDAPPRHGDIIAPGPDAALLPVPTDSDDIAGLSLTPPPQAEPVVESLISHERDLWARHPATHSYLCNQTAMVVNQPLLDVSRDAVAARNSFLSEHLDLASNLNETHDPPRPEKDIGTIDIVGPPKVPLNLESTEQVILQDIHKVIGDKPVSEFQLQFAPRWIIDKAIQAEKSNYRNAEAYEEIPYRDLPHNANIISSHHFFQMKTDGEAGKLKLKCRLVPHGNRDRDKDEVRKDSATAQFPIIRLVLSICTILHFTMATLDIKSAYLQAGPMPRLIFVRPPRGWASAARLMWRMLKPAYGIVESGRLWQLAIEAWMTEQGICEMPGLPQLFTKRGQDGKLVLVIAKVVDDLLIAGTAAEVRKFHAAIEERFKVGRFLTDGTLVFNGLHITVEDAGIKVTMNDYLDKIAPLDVPHHRRKQQHLECTDAERKEFLGLTGSLNFLGHGILPQAAFLASHLQQSIARLKVAHLCTANRCLREAKALSPSMFFRRPDQLLNPTYLAFSDASQGRTSYGQTGFLAGLYLPADEGGIYHIIDWISSKQGRVSFSAMGAEILAAATSADRGSMMAERITELYAAKFQLPFNLSVDSHGLYSTVTTLHEGPDYRLRPTVSRIRDSFENGEITVVQWIPGTQNLADALTKRNIAMFKKLNDVMTTGVLGDDILEQAKRTKSDNGK